MDFTDDFGHHSSVKTNPLGHKTLYENGMPTATQKPSLLNKTTTIAHGEVIAQTKEGPVGETKIYQEGKLTGTIKDNSIGVKTLYDNAMQSVAQIDVQGNAKTLLNHQNPLSQVERLNFQQLQFHQD